MEARGGEGGVGERDFRCQTAWEVNHDSLITRIVAGGGGGFQAASAMRRRKRGYAKTLVEDGGFEEELT
jgi:hypothetical protein